MSLSDTPMSWETNPHRHQRNHDYGNNHNNSEDERDGSRQDDDDDNDNVDTRSSKNDNHNNTDNRIENHDEQQQQRNIVVSKTEIEYSIESYGAIVTPVSLTMILSSLAVVLINTEETVAAGEEAYARTYQVFDLEEGNATQNLGASIANTLIIVGVICVATFIIVLLYKYKCLKCFYLYMVVVTAMLLGYFTANMWYEMLYSSLSFALLFYPHSG
jgi:hypothetical protein